MIIKYFAFVFIELVASFMNYFLAPIVVLFASKDGWLPRWLWWFQTPGDTLDKDYHLKTYPGKQTGWKRWFARTAWLYRNSMYGLCYGVLGAKCCADDTLVTTTSSPIRKVSNRPVNSGYVFHRLYRDGKLIYFQYYWVAQHSAERCLRVNIGWKLWDFAQGEKLNCQLVFSPNPFMGLSHAV